MVKTRHGGGDDDDDDDTNEQVDADLSITNNRTRRHDSLRTKELRTNGYQSGSSSEEKYGRHRRKKRRRYVSSSSRNSSSSSDEATLPASPHEPQSSPSRPRRRSSRTRRHFNIEGFDTFDHVTMGVRRSTRQKKFTYDTFNQNLMIDGPSVESTEVDDHSVERGVEGDGETKKKSLGKLEVEPLLEAEMDMYTRVKRERRSIKRDMYGIPINDDSKDKSASSTSETESDSDNKESGVKSYNLRVHCPKTNLYKAPPIEPRGPPRVQRSSHRSEERPSFRSLRSSTGSSRRRRKRAAFHSSTSSSSSSDDEQKFERRKSRSMVKARQRCLPMNLTGDDLAVGVLRDRSHAGASMADIEPMAIDRTVMFDKIGGLGKHLRALKEMIVFPLLYPEIFTRFKIAPPRGVLFYGPPGTGKTLVARALANECSSSDTKVAFFMRKGADCLSKWVGESERQLRLLFDQAYQMRPSIIFFDEIDGLAPVRSSRQDQIHSSIVSTLLALMDGLDDRGEVVVIGATNRIDSIDPALRRPGRFDREFLFPLPPYEARRQILEIHTREWNPRLADLFIAELAQKTVGYCGADLKALCTEAALRALRRRYPQIYESRDKLQIDVTSVNISAGDFYSAMKCIVPTAQRSVSSPARPLSSVVRPLLQQIFTKTLRLFERIFPVALALVNGAADAGGATCQDVVCSDDEAASDMAAENGIIGNTTSTVRRHVTPTHRPRLLISGERGQGQSSHLGPAILHHFECLPVHVIDLAALYAVGTKTPEEACTQILHEAQRTSPSVIYIPHINDWWHVTTDAVRTTFTSILNDVDPATPVLLLATSDVEYKRLPSQAKELFNETADEIVVMRDPDEADRKAFFEDLLLHRTCDPPLIRNKTAERRLEALPKADKLEARQLTTVELNRLRDQEEQTFRELRLFLRDVINKLGRDRKFAMFAKPVDISEVPDYCEIIKTPMDLSTMMTKIDLHKYQTVQQFLRDIDLICSNALEYNPDRDPQDRAIRHRACALKDTAYAIIAGELDTNFEKMCEDIVKARERRGESTSDPPSYYCTKPVSSATTDGMVTSEPVTENGPQRCSRRVRGIAASNGVTAPGAQPAPPSYRVVTKRIRCRSKPSSLKSLWCRSNRPKYRNVVVYIDENGKELSALDVHKRNKGNAVVQNSNTQAAFADAANADGAKVKCSPRSAQLKKSVADNAMNETTKDDAVVKDSSSLLHSSKAEGKCAAKPNASTAVVSRASTENVPAGIHTVVINKAQCASLLAKTVSRTVGHSVDSLLRLHHQMSLCVYQHRHSYDKSSLLKDLELCLQRLTEQRPSNNHRPVSL